MKRLKLKPFFLVLIQILFFVLLGFDIYGNDTQGGVRDELIGGIGKGH